MGKLNINQIGKEPLKQLSLSVKKADPTTLYKPLKDPLHAIALATVPSALAAIAMQKKDSENTIPNPEEFAIALRKMTRPDGTPRFSEENIDYLLRKAYKEDPALTWRIVNLKSKDNYWVIDQDHDIINSVLSYKQHPELSEVIFQEVQNSDRKTASKLIQYSYIDSNKQDLLLKLYNIRTFENIPSVEFYQVNEVINAYEEKPELYEKLLTEKDAKGNIARSGHDILNIYNAYKINPKIVETLLEIVDRYNDKLSGLSILEIVSNSEENRKFYIELLQMKDGNGPRFSKSDIDDINALKKGNIYKSGKNATKVINELLYIKNFNGEYLCKPKDITKIAEFGDLEQQKFIIKLLKRGIEPEKAITLSTHPERSKIYFLIKNNVSLTKIDNAILHNKLEKLIEETTKNVRPLQDFFRSPNYETQVQRNSAGKYQKELTELINPKKAPYVFKSKLFDSKLSEEEVLSSLKKISKSSFKLAYDTPNQYLEGLDASLSTPVNGHYPKLSPEDLALKRQKVIKFFGENMPSLMYILNYIDVDIINHLMDKRFKLFQEELDLINKMPKELLEIFKNLQQCNSEETGKPLSVKEKMQLYNILKMFHVSKLNTKPLEEAVKNNTVSIEKLKKYIYSEILKISDVNIDVDKIDGKKKFNENYAYLILNPSAVNTLTENERLALETSLMRDIINMRQDKCYVEEFKSDLQEELAGDSKQIKKTIEKLFNALDNIEKHTDDEILELWFDVIVAFNDKESNAKYIYTIVKESTTNDFKSYINNPENIFGQANLKTKEIFEKKGLSYEQYSNPDIPDIDFQIAGKNYKIKIWERNPYEDLFMGNKTTCCTAIGGVNGAATPLYLMNTCWNVIQMFNEKGDVVGMSRVFIGEHNGECSLMMDNIELNNKLTANMGEKEKLCIRDKFFEYMHNYVEKVTGNKDAKVYLGTMGTLVPTTDLKRLEENIDFVGKNATDSIYINTNSFKWCNTEKLKDLTLSWYIVPKK